MGWYRGNGKENHKSLFDKPLKDLCLFCGSGGYQELRELEKNGTLLKNLE